MARVTTFITVRQEWAEGSRRLESERDDPRRHRVLHAQAAAVGEELRRRMGGIFTLGELAEEYGRAEVWSRRLVAELPRELQATTGLTIAVDAAFHLFSRGARDYEP